jgi:hypothetical protein
MYGHIDCKTGRDRRVLTAPDAVVMAVDGSMLGMQVRPTRRRRKNADALV